MMSDAYIASLQYNLSMANEKIKEQKVKIDEYTAENKGLREKYEKLLKDNMEMADRYLSIIEKIKEIGVG